MTSCPLRSLVDTTAVDVDVESQLVKWKGLFLKAALFGHPSKLMCLDAARAFAQDRYQFGVHRRTMLLQAPDPCSGGAHIAKQISDIVANCDASTEALVRTVDPAAQLDRLLDQHWGSALAIVLRKLRSLQLSQGSSSTFDVPWIVHYIRASLLSTL
ncbi:hypothetical protein EV714DRAFT_273776 [Schizophyllum commune]